MEMMNRRTIIRFVFDRSDLLTWRETLPKCRVVSDPFKLVLTLAKAAPKWRDFIIGLGRFEKKSG